MLLTQFAARVLWSARVSFPLAASIRSDNKTLKCPLQLEPRTPMGCSASPTKTKRPCGSLPITFGDYGMSTPSSFNVLSIEDRGTLELQLSFTQA